MVSRSQRDSGSITLILFIEKVTVCFYNLDVLVVGVVILNQVHRLHHRPRSVNVIKVVSITVPQLFRSERSIQIPLNVVVYFQR